MIAQPGPNRQRPIDLLDEKQPSDLVRKGHRRKREDDIGTGEDVRGQTRGPAHDERNRPRIPVAVARQHFRKIPGAHRCPAFVQNHGLAAQAREDSGALPARRPVVPVPLRTNDDFFESRPAREPRPVTIEPPRVFPRFCFSDPDETKGEQSVGRGEANRLVARISPEPLQRVESPRFVEKDVENNVSVVEQNPAPGSLPLDGDRRAMESFHPHFERIRDCLGLSLGGRRADHEVVGE